MRSAIELFPYSAKYLLDKDLQIRLFLQMGPTNWNTVYPSLVNAFTFCHMSLVQSFLHPFKKECRVDLTYETKYIAGIETV